MGLPRLSIASLMAVMIPVALGLVAFREATQFWVDTVFNLVVASLLLATYKARCSRGTAGAWWTGFAAFGWTHQALGLVGMPWGQHFGVSPNLVTIQIAWRLVAYIDPDPSAAALQAWTARFLVLHSLLSLVLALLGAATFSFFAGRGERATRRGRGGVPTESSGPASPAATPPSPLRRPRSRSATTP
jgi:hypothetical protein